MLPPLCLRPEAHHAVLDLCAPVGPAPAPRPPHPLTHTQTWATAPHRVPKAFGRPDSGFSRAAPGPIPLSVHSGHSALHRPTLAGLTGRPGLQVPPVCRPPDRRCRRRGPLARRRSRLRGGGGQRRGPPEVHPGPPRPPHPRHARPSPTGHQGRPSSPPGLSITHPTTIPFPWALPRSGPTPKENRSGGRTFARRRSGRYIRFLPVWGVPLVLPGRAVRQAGALRERRRHAHTAEEPPPPSEGEAWRPRGNGRWNQRTPRRPGK